MFDINKYIFDLIKNIVPNNIIDELFNFIGKYIKNPNEIYEYIIKLDSVLLSAIPPEHKTLKLCKLALEFALPHEIQIVFMYIPHVFRTVEICKIALKKYNSFEIFHEIPIKIFQTHEMLSFIISNNEPIVDTWYHCTRHIYDEINNVITNEITDEITDEITEKLVFKGYEPVSYLPEKYHTYKMYKLSVEYSGRNLEHVPSDMITLELCEIAVQYKYHDMINAILRWVPNQFRTPEICKNAVINNLYSWDYVPRNLITSELVEAFITSHPDMLMIIPDSLRTPKICEISVRGNGISLENVPPQIITQELCNAAIDSNIEAFGCVPQRFRTPKLCEHIFNVIKNINTIVHTGDLLDMIDNINIDSSTLREYVLKNINALQLVFPNKFDIVSDIYIDIVCKNISLLQYVPANFLTEKLFMHLIFHHLTVSSRDSMNQYFPNIHVNSDEIILLVSFYVRHSIVSKNLINLFCPTNSTQNNCSNDILFDTYELVEQFI